MLYPFVPTFLLLAGCYHAILRDYVRFLAIANRICSIHITY
ncbi:hypothetical protein HMPREF1580_00402 [Gardnerella vaginalis JCP8070]|nr:hypothetical protein HMPREF1582_01415 [Gardnerella vaginalis JCP8151A]EPI46971.1 hypothetical protein HMPREF1583_00739 [Gardnerella vaginalis JCP8151B]EPI60488.1 hypothetical protein HMPREF1580_00402 [Gardnerella vaginalis JCP8070]